MRTLYAPLFFFGFIAAALSLAAHPLWLVPLLASAVLIRNCMGIAVLIVLFCGALTPVLHMAVRCGMFYLLAAIAQPVADQRIVGCLRVVARGYGVYVRLLAGTVVLFFLVVAVMTQTA